MAQRRQDLAAGRARRTATGPMEEEDMGEEGKGGRIHA